jgi:cyclomaltodextrinase / maltogenic alpha-amylase / neopullulanase
MEIITPDWVKDAIFYQIFPDRFCRGTHSVLSRGLQFKPWGSDPQEQGYQGGDLYGVLEKLDYLQDLGISAIYLNPIFASASNHRYHTYDYLQVDPLLGGNRALQVLIAEIHRRGMHIILDGVFNHCGRGFWAFHHILENGKNSPYIGWFTIERWPLHPYPGKHEHPNYFCWWNNPALPKFNIQNPGVRDYLLGVARHWIEFGIDGWRLDVAEEIDDDSFWQEFRRAVKDVNPEAYIVAEIWHPAEHWLKGDQFDAVMNYQITGPVLSFFGADTLNTSWRHPDVRLNPCDAAMFARDINKMFNLYDWSTHYVQMNMLDSHDMPRGVWLLGEDKSALRLALLCQVTMPGAPCVYYGSEIGMSGGGDPFCRAAFPWEPKEWDQPLHDYYKKVIHLRSEHPALRTGSFQFLYAAAQQTAYRRNLAGEEMVVIFNAAKHSARVEVDAGLLEHTCYRTVFPEGNATYSVDEHNLNIHLAAQSALVLIGE